MVRLLKIMVLGVGAAQQQQQPPAGAGRCTREDTGLSCGETRGALWQHKMSVAARQDLCGGKTQGNHTGGRPPKAAAPFVRPPPLCLATTEVLPCRNRHLVLPQRTFVCPHERSVVSQHPSRIRQHPSASISMHHASRITQHASSIIHRWGVKKFMIFHFF